MKRERWWMRGHMMDSRQELDLQLLQPNEGEEKKVLWDILI